MSDSDGGGEGSTERSQADQSENEVAFPHEFDKLGNMGKGRNGLKQERISLHHIALRRIECLAVGDGDGDREELDTPPRIFSFLDAENPHGNSESVWVRVLQ